MKCDILMAQNLEILEVGYNLPASLSKTIVRGSKFNLASVLPPADQPKAANFLRWYLESDNDSFLVETSYLNDQGQQFSIHFHRTGNGLRASFSFETSEKVDDNSKKVFFWDNFISSFDQGVIYVNPDGIIDFSSKEATVLLEIRDSSGITYSGESIVGRNLIHLLDKELSTVLISFFQFL